MNSIKKFLQSSAIFFVGNLLSRAISFFLLPIYTKNISTTDYGYYDLSITYLTIITSVLFFDIWATVMRFMFDKNEEKNKYSSILSGFVVFSMSTIVYIVIGIVVAQIVDIKYLTLIIAYGIFLNMQNMFSYITRGFEKNKNFAISGILNTLFVSISSIVLIVFAKVDYSALYVAGIIGNIVQILYLELKVNLRKNLKIELLEKNLTMEMFKYTLPLCINSASFWLLTSFNRIVISKVLTVSDNGIYAIGNKFAVIITLITTCFTLAWQEISFDRKIDDKTNAKFYSDACNLYIGFLGIGLILLIPTVNIIFHWLVDNSYYQAKGIIPLFLIATVINAFSNFIGNIFYAQKDTKNIFISALISAMLNVLLSYPLIKLLGLNGATLSMLISFMINILIRYKILNKKILLKFNVKNILLLTIFILCSWYIYNMETYINIIWLVIACFVLIFLFKKNIKKIVFSLLKKEKI